MGVLLSAEYLRVLVVVKEEYIEAVKTNYGTLVAVGQLLAQEGVLEKHSDVVVANFGALLDA